MLGRETGAVAILLTVPSNPDTLHHSYCERVVHYFDCWDWDVLLFGSRQKGERRFPAMGVTYPTNVNDLRALSPHSRKIKFKLLFLVIFQMNNHSKAKPVPMQALCFR